MARMLSKTIFALFVAAAHVLEHASPDERRLFSADDALSIARDVREGVPEPAWADEQDFLLEQAWEEGRWRVSPLGSNDAGAACGVVQINRWQIPEGLGTCEELRASRVAAFRAWHAMFAATLTRCGSVRSALGAIMSTGKCGAVPKLVARRCARSGAC